jgi:hypothetical protein
VNAPRRERIGRTHGVDVLQQHDKEKDNGH